MNKNKYFAAIDMGSNAVRFVIKSVEVDPSDNSESLTQDLLVRFPLRLGEDAFMRKKISKGREKQLLNLMKSFQHMLKIFPIVDFKAYATSAMRDSSNGKKITEKVLKKTGINIEIIGGEEEARIIYDTHIERMLGQEANFMYMDVGGGSTQISVIHAGEPIYSHSFNIGTVRMMKDKVDPKEKQEFLSKLREFRVQYPDLQLVGSGGNINKIYSLLHTKKDRSMLNVGKMKHLYKELSPLCVETRMKKYRIKRDRAEVIGFAAGLFIDAADAMQMNTIVVPSISIADGIINKMYQKYADRNR